MFKSLALSIKGFFRSKAEEATDLRYAGKEHIHQIKGSIEEVRNERNRIAGQGVLLESKIKHLQKDIEIALNAVRHWASVGDNARRDRAHAEYVELQTDLNEKNIELEDIQKQVADLDTQIKTLEKDTAKAKNSIGKAATKQTVARATNRVENIHDDLRAGPLSGVINTAEESAAYAEARRRDRNANDNSDLYAYQTAANVMSLDDILGSAAESKPVIKVAESGVTTSFGLDDPHKSSGYTATMSHHDHSSGSTSSSDGASDSSVSSSD